MTVSFIASAAIVLVMLFLIIIMLIDGNRFVVREYYYMAPQLKKSAKVILLSDLHNKSYGQNNQVLLRAIEKAAPDYILVAGDMLTAAKGQSFRPAIELLQALAEKYPVYYGNGNHEYRISLYPQQYGTLHEDYERALGKLPVQRLINQHVYLPELNVQIYGLNMDRIYYKRFGRNKMSGEYLNETLGKPDRDRVNLLIAHNPEYFKEYAAWGADLVVAGHVHGGIMRLPFLGGVISPRFRLFPEYDGGLFTEKKSTMILSRGLGTHTLPIRIFNPGELVVIYLRH